MKFETPLGTILGKTDNGITRIMGITYAKAARFKRPVLINQLPKPFYAVEQSYASPQGSDPYFAKIFGHDVIENLTMNEQCLQLSITRPSQIQEGSNLPVMIWIHGGGYISGGGDSIGTNPSQMVIENNVLVVSVSYRLGIFGFLGGYQNIPANLGLLDIIAALKWVQKNISYFGGDKHNVTLFGQSAGGDAIAHLMAADDVEGLFHKVIIQSAPFGLRKGKTKLTNQMISVSMHSDLNADSKELLKIQDKILQSAQGFGLQSGMPFGVQYGFYPLPDESEIEKVWQRRCKEYEVLIGYNKDETSVFVPVLDDLKKLIQLPLIGSWLNNWIISLTTKYVYKHGAKLFYKRYKKAGGSIALYKLSFGSKTNGLGAAHTMELPLLFWNKEVWKDTELLKDISQAYIDQFGYQLRKMWCNFAKKGRDSLPKSYKDMHIQK